MAAFSLLNEAAPRLRHGSSGNVDPGAALRDKGAEERHHRRPSSSGLAATCARDDMPPPVDSQQQGRTPPAVSRAALNRAGSSLSAVNNAPKKDSRDAGSVDGLTSVGPTVDTVAMAAQTELGSGGGAVASTVSRPAVEGAGRLSCPPRRGDRHNDSAAEVLDLGAEEQKQEEDSNEKPAGGRDQTKQTAANARRQFRARKQEQTPKQSAVGGGVRPGVGKHAEGVEGGREQGMEVRETREKDVEKGQEGDEDRVGIKLDSARSAVDESEAEEEGQGRDGEMRGNVERSKQSGRGGVLREECATGDSNLTVEFGSSGVWEHVRGEGGACFVLCVPACNTAYGSIFNPRYAAVRRHIRR